jgi:hypothetical protein
MKFAMLLTTLIALLQDAPAAGSGTQNTVKLICGGLAVVLVIVIILRRKGAKKKDEEEF